MMQLAHSGAVSMGTSLAHDARLVKSLTKTQGLEDTKVWLESSAMSTTWRAGSWHAGLALYSFFATMAKIHGTYISMCSQLPGRASALCCR